VGAILVIDWIAEHAIKLDSVTYEPVVRDARRVEAFDASLDAAKILFLGETNHFVHEKTDFRLWYLRRLGRRRPLVVGEELSWSDGHDVSRYLQTGDEAHLGRAATFGSGRWLVVFQLCELRAQLVDQLRQRPAVVGER
jgi:erythromycin esterase-like protein